MNYYISHYKCWYGIFTEINLRGQWPELCLVIHHTIIPPFIPFTKSLYYFVSVRFTFASLSSSRFALHACLNPFNHINQSLPLFHLPSISNSYTILVSCTLLLHFTYQYHFETFRFARSLIFLSLELCASHVLSSLFVLVLSPHNLQTLHLHNIQFVLPICPQTQVFWSIQQHWYHKPSTRLLPHSLVYAPDLTHLLQWTKSLHYSSPFIYISSCEPPS